MKHAYLIIAHHEPGLLILLLSKLDDERNDIYVHIDKKASFSGVKLATQHSNLYVSENRIDGRWGDYSLVEIELLLFHSAYSNGPYAYYHLLSGVDLPIKSQDYIHDFCNKNKGQEFVGIAQNVPQSELDWRSQHWFLFARDFQSENLLKKIIRAAFARLQSLVGYRRTALEIKKGSQWCSITHDFVGYLLQNERIIRKTFRHTYCPDELFIQTLCWNSYFKKNIYDLNDEFEGCKRYIKWEKGVLQPLTIQEADDMNRSSRWFARKFTSKDMDVVQKVLRCVQCSKFLS